MRRRALETAVAWTLTVGALAWIAAEAVGPFAAVLVTLAAVGSPIALLYQPEEAAVPRPTNPSPTDAANLRRTADRLVQLGVLTSWAFDREESPRSLTVRTAADEVVEVPRRDAPALLRGLALGAWAVSHG